MNPNPHHPMTSAQHADSIEETLRVIANLPAPAGLEGRVHEALRAAPRSNRVLYWPAKLRTRIIDEHHWMRAAAAAAIVFVVMGGGWGVYTRVERNQPTKVLMMPARVPGSGGFAGAGAIRVPGTLPGPSLKSSARRTAAPKKKKPSGAKPASMDHAGHKAAPQPAVAR